MGSGPSKDTTVEQFKSSDPELSKQLQHNTTNALTGDAHTVNIGNHLH